MCRSWSSDLEAMLQQCTQRGSVCIRNGIEQQKRQVFIIMGVAVVASSSSTVLYAEDFRFGCSVPLCLSSGKSIVEILKLYTAPRENGRCGLHAGNAWLETTYHPMPNVRLFFFFVQLFWMSTKGSMLKARHFFFVQFWVDECTLRSVTAQNASDSRIAPCSCSRRSGQKNGQIPLPATLKHKKLAFPNRFVFV